jgi:hypothetical protein
MPFFETSDGQIAHIDARTNSVWINRGSADGLRRQTYFSVWNHEVQRVDVHQTREGSDALGRNRGTGGKVSNDPNYKGAIEVTEILGPHLAACRVLDHNLADPMLDSDQIYSPIWDPGKAMHFALVGKLDADGDGNEDRTLIRNLITQSGGIIDAEDTDKEDRRLNAETRFVIRGDAPAESDEARNAQWTRLLSEAQANAVDVITLNKFLSFAGFKEIGKVQQFGAGAASRDVPIVAPDGGFPISSGDVSAIYLKDTGIGAFRPRQPPRNPPGAPASDEPKKDAGGAADPFKDGGNPDAGN